MPSLVVAKKALLTAAHRTMWTTNSRAGGAVRLFAIRRRVVLHDPSTFHPNDTQDAVKPPHYWVEPDPDAPEPMMYIRKPVTSASAIDLTSRLPKLSVPDAVSLTAEGAVRHGRYGILPRSVVENIPLEYLALLHPSAQAAAALRIVGMNEECCGNTETRSVVENIPLEYLALLHPSAQAAAALRMILESSNSSSSGGTVLVYGASQPAGMAATQLAASSSSPPLAVIAVVDAQHSGDSEMVDCVKNMAPYPGTAVPEEFAVIKRDFYDLVNLTVAGEQRSTSNYNCATDFLPDFVDNLVDFAAFFPQEKGAAVLPSLKVFAGKEKDRAKFHDNMEAYLEQFPQGVPPVPPKAEIKEKFGPDVYAIYKSRFGIQTSSIISGDEDLPDFEPSQLVKTLMYTSPEELQKELSTHYTSNNNRTSDFVPFDFNVLSPIHEEEFKGAGPVVGAIVVATPTLVKACEAVAKGKTLREKAEALQYLTQMEQKAFAAATAVVTVAKKAGKDVVVVGDYSLPGHKSVELKTDDVHTALSAMEVQDDGSSKLNFFVQVYRAGDFPVYESYAIHRATEPLSGPRQIVVTK
eukprot:CAMPEP_0172436050 /NCGR_PEP_ID=MMETSP1064-20121228/71510_1 /TAXON_ID=202472 /ORGANISM="Aulacoseira subarctica , Strain CCAP 1002/5" /LENGTH=578 /DNA_ID=CAMNT_0013184433 /DNA_START=92 /DNA_END=1829 /DNA_ORIENTATION=-